LAELAVIFGKGIKKIKIVFWISAAAVFTTAAVLSVYLYSVWQANGFTRSFLPPHTPINYFLLYSGFKFFFPYFLSLAVALLFIFWMKAANRKHEGNFFEEEEPYLAGLGIFLSGHPGWMIYLLAIVFCYLIIHLFQRLKGIKNKRVPLYYLWIPVGLFVILINAFWLSRCSWWLLLKM
jgi:hypothetical protein